MTGGSKDENKALLEAWIKEVRTRHNLQLQHVQVLASAAHLDESGFRSLDSTLKKVTAFMKKLKNIGTTVTPASLLPELEKLNVSKFLDEIAMNICEAKIKISDISSLIVFCVKVSSLYSSFPGILTAELKKQIPFKKTDVITNPSKLRVDLKFLAELVLNGVLQKEGIQLLGSTLSFILNTDKSEHVNLRLSKTVDADVTSYRLASTLFSEDQRNAVVNLFRSYFESLVQHVNEIRLEMNRLQKSIKRQERTRGDASADDRQKFDLTKSNYDRLLQNATDVSECLGMELPDMVEEPSDDEQDELAAKKLDIALNEGRMMLWPDFDTQLFYEKLTDVRRLALRPPSESIDEDDKEMADDNEPNALESAGNFVQQQINESIDMVDMTNLEVFDDLHQESVGEPSQVDEDEEEEIVFDEQINESETLGASEEDIRKLNNAEVMTRGHAPSTSIKEFLGKLTLCINRRTIFSLL